MRLERLTSTRIGWTGCVTIPLALLCLNRRTPHLSIRIPNRCTFQSSFRVYRSCDLARILGNILLRRLRRFAQSSKERETSPAWSCLAA